jgi:hypothetical protein
MFLAPAGIMTLVDKRSTLLPTLGTVAAANAALVFLDRRIDDLPKKNKHYFLEKM